MVNYAMQCQYGRNHAEMLIAEVITNGNTPKLVREMQKAANDKTGFGAGFLFQISERLT